MYVGGANDLETSDRRSLDVSLRGDMQSFIPGSESASSGILSFVVVPMAMKWPSVSHSSGPTSSTTGPLGQMRIVSPITTTQAKATATDAASRGQAQANPEAPDFSAKSGCDMNAPPQYLR